MQHKVNVYNQKYPSVIGIEPAMFHTTDRAHEENTSFSLFTFCSVLNNTDKR